MGIRRRAVQLIGITALITLIIVYIISRTIIIGSVLQQEVKSTKKTIFQVQKILGNECYYLSNTVTDWSQYDSTYDFMKTNSKEYIKENLLDSTFHDIQVNFMVFINKSGNIIWEKGFDIENNRQIAIPKPLQNCFEKGSSLIDFTNTNSKKSGLLYVNNKLLLLASHPVTSTDTLAPMDGVLVMGRYLSADKLNYINDLTESSVSFKGITSNTNTPLNTGISGLSSSIGDQMEVKPLNKNYVKGYSICKDVNLKSNILITVIAYRDAYIKSINDLRIFGIFLLISVLVVFVIFMLLIDRTIISRLTKLNDFINEIGISGNTTSRVKVEGQDEVSNLGIAMNKMLNFMNNAEMELKELLEKVYSLLDNSEEGFLTINEHFLIDKEYSRECRLIFNKEIANLNIIALIKEYNIEAADALEKGINMLLETDDSYKREVIITLLPAVMKIDSKTIKVKYKILENNKVMLILTDISRERQLEAKIKEEQKRLKLIVASFTNKDDIYDILNTYKTFINNGYKDILKRNTNNISKLDEIYRSVHTMKGVFSQFSFIYVPQELDNIEDMLSKLRKDMDGFEEKINLIFEKDKCEKALESDMRIINEIHGDSFVSNNKKVCLDEERLLKLELAVDKIKMRLGDIDKDETVLDALNTASTLRYRDLREMLSIYPSYVDNLSIRLGKLIDSFNIEGSEIRIDPNKYNNFIKSLVHVFRNAADHGIETPDERLEAGKEITGHIKCSVEEKDGRILIIIADDGKGINLNKVRQKALDKGILTEDASISLSDKDTAKLIFHDSFSTKDMASDISGRGYGLSAVIYELDKIDGEVTVETIEGQGTSFIFTV